MGQFLIMNPHHFLTKITIIVLNLSSNILAIPFLFTSNPNNSPVKLFENCPFDNVVRKQFGAFKSEANFQQWVRNSFQTSELTLEKYVKERDARLQETSSRELTDSERIQIEKMFSLVFSQLDADRNGVFEFNDLKVMDCRKTANDLIKLNKGIEQLKEKIKKSVDIK